MSLFPASVYNRFPLVGLGREPNCAKTEHFPHVEMTLSLAVRATYINYERHTLHQKDWEDYPAPLLLPPVSKNTLETEPEGRTKSLPFTSSLLLSLPPLPLPRSIHTPVQPAAPKEPEPEKGLKRRQTAQGPPPCAAARGRDLGTDQLPNGQGD